MTGALLEEPSGRAVEVVPEYLAFPRDGADVS